MTLPCDQIEASRVQMERDRPLAERTRWPQGSDEIAAKLREVGALVGQGLLITEAVRRIGVSDSTYYRWRAECRVQADQNRPDPDRAQRLHRLELENTRLRRAVADLIIEKQALKEVVPDFA